MGFADANCPHGFNALVMKNITIRNIHSYKHERIQVIGPACGGLSNWCAEILPPSTYKWYLNQAFLAIRRTNLDVMNQPLSMSLKVNSKALLALHVQYLEVNFFIQLKFTAAWA